MDLLETDETGISPRALSLLCQRLQQCTGVCLCQPYSGCSDRSPLPVKPISHTPLHQWLPDHAPGYVKLNLNPAPAGCPHQPLSLGRGGHLGAESQDSGVSTTGTSPFPPHSYPWLHPPNCFGAMEAPVWGILCSPPSKPCWNTVRITGGVTEGKSHISTNGDNYCSNRYKTPALPELYHPPVSASCAE